MCTERAKPNDMKAMAMKLQSSHRETVSQREGEESSYQFQYIKHVEETRKLNHPKGFITMLLHPLSHNLC